MEGIRESPLQHRMKNYYFKEGEHMGSPLQSWHAKMHDFLTYCQGIGVVYEFPLFLYLRRAYNYLILIPLTSQW